MDKEFKAKFTADNSDLNRKMKDSESEGKSFSNKMIGFAQAMAAAWGLGEMIAGLKRFLTESVKAYDIQAKAEQSLLVALKGRSDIQHDIIIQARELQKTTLFGDEQTIEGAARLAMLLGDDKVAIQRLLPLVQDLATAKFGGSLVTAADLVAKSIGSSTNALTRYGIEITGAVGSSERLETAIAGLNKQVGGQAKAAAEVGTGSIEQLKNMYSDLKEEIGQSVLRSDALKTSVTGLKKVVQDMTDIAHAENLIAEDKHLSWWDKLLFRVAKFSKVGRDAIKDMGDLVEANKFLTIAEGEVIKKTEATSLTISDYRARISDIDSALESLTAGEGKQAQTLLQQKKNYQDIIDSVLNYSSALEEVNKPSLVSEGPTISGLNLEDTDLDQKISDAIDLNNKLVESIKPIEKSYTAAENAAMSFSEQMIKAGSDGELSLKSFAKTAVTIAKKVIATYIAQGVAKAVESALTKIPFPLNLIAGAVAGAGAAALFNSIVPSFAEGGAAMGPTMALIGEAPGISRSNPEYIGTAQQLGKMGLGGGNLTARVSRGDLLFVLNEGESYNKRNY